MNLGADQETLEGTTTRTRSTDKTTHLTSPKPKKKDKKHGVLLFREVNEGVVSDNKKLVRHTVGTYSCVSMYQPIKLVIKLVV